MEPVHPDLGDPEQNAVMSRRISEDMKKDAERERAAAAPTMPPAKLTDTERLEIENIFLKIQNAQLQVQNIDNAKVALVEQMRELQKEMDEKRKALSAKYGVDITRATVKPDGTIIAPRPLADPFTGIAGSPSAVARILE